MDEEKDYLGKSIEEIMKEIEKTKEKIDSDIDNKKIKENNNEEFGLHAIKETYEKEIDKDETKFHNGSLRSGQKLEYDGSLVIIGDVNMGAEVFATGNIVVLGSLRGIAHAGAKGNKKAIISAIEIISPQIRIADIVKEMHEEMPNKRMYARIVEKDIVIEN